MIPGKEQGDLVRTIIEQLDHEVEAIPTVNINIDGLDITINIHYHPGGDGKAAKTSTGLGGAYCTMCKVTKKEASDPNIAKNGYPINRDRDQNLQLFADVKKNPDGTVDTRVPTQLRFGITQEPPATNMDGTKLMPTMHTWIRDLTDYERLAMFLYARDIFPNKIPIMDGKYPASHRKKILAKLAEAKKFLQDQARRGPLKMLLMMPDAHGTGGSSDNGPTARKIFSYENRQDVLDLFPTATATERIALGLIHLLKTSGFKKIKGGVSMGHFHV